MGLQGPSTPHDLLGFNHKWRPHSSAPAHCVLRRFEGFSRAEMNQTTLNLSAASSLTDDFIAGAPRSPIQSTHCTYNARSRSHNIALAFIFYFYARWAPVQEKHFSLCFQIAVNWPYIMTGMVESKFLSQVPLNPQGFLQRMDQCSKRNRSQDICVTSRD